MIHDPWFGRVCMISWFMGYFGYQNSRSRYRCHFAKKNCLSFFPWISSRVVLAETFDPRDVGSSPGCGTQTLKYLWCNHMTVTSFNQQFKVYKWCTLTNDVTIFQEDIINVFDQALTQQVYVYSSHPTLSTEWISDEKSQNHSSIYSSNISVHLQNYYTKVARCKYFWYNPWLNFH